jgi:transcriptional regulator with XRE-family HTH domain
MTDRTNALVGAAMRTSREAVGMSQSVLASSLGLSRTSVTNIENGKQPISIHHLYLAAAALGLSVRDLLPELAPLERRQGRRSAEVAALLSRLESSTNTVES